MPSQPRGALLALLAFALFSAHDAVVKALGGRYDTFQILFFAVLLSFPLATFLLMRDGEPGTLRPRHPGWVAVRTAATTLTGLCTFHAFGALPLAQVYAILFAAPLIITVLSIPLLGERVRLRRSIAILVGLAGVMVVLRPGAIPLGLGHLAALGAAFGGALASVIVRKIGREERPVVLMLYPLAANFVIAGSVMPFVYRPVAGADLALLACIAGLGFCATLTLIAAYKRAEATTVAPMQYSQIVWATVLGALLFAEAPDGWTLLGAGIVIGSGLYILLRESRGASATTPVLRSRSRIGTPGLPRVSVLMDRARPMPPPAGPGVRPRGLAGPPGRAGALHRRT
ncbi:drug/metabolite transporter (DMT)-like permease [Hasllibacter halocynthiae]|uniref:Drug/metabolite transporter (DMT)-like permease n=1 Tax=Hasllibacter halocynthiae TaxID=595589 RepID=A0A2T0X1S3_9RHOB|nr:DMT family transporter [Hasllibacter halocynthiae]PRY92835.1 drug/metabolite transporter (DMT)-like permease [Hasllibacter halocynthiae]